MNIHLPDERVLIDALLVAFDLFGTFVFAISGGIAAVKYRLDLFGVLVLSFAAATSGGMMRDLLIGAIPPASLQDWRYLAVSILAGLITFVWSPMLCRLQNAVLIFDAAGLALFAVSGAGKALAYHLAPIPARSALQSVCWRSIGSGASRLCARQSLPRTEYAQACSQQPGHRGTELEEWRRR
jgi:uncharacterized membrane protein YeiH